MPARVQVRLAALLALSILVPAAAGAAEQRTAEAPPPLVAAPAAPLAPQRTAALSPAARVALAAEMDARLERARREAAGFAALRDAATDADMREAFESHIAAVKRELERDQLNIQLRHVVAAGDESAAQALRGALDALARVPAPAVQAVVAPATTPAAPSAAVRRAAKRSRR